MYSIFINSEISTSYDSHRLLLDFYRIKQTQREEISFFIYQILVSILHDKICKKSYKNNKVQVSNPTWNIKFELSDK